MRYGSVCSGVEAASVAWHPLGWEPSWFAEIDPFPSAVLAHRWPGVENRGDFTRIDESAGSIDVLVGGTPCQSFSIAGRRAGLDDPRGNLAIEFLRLARRGRPRWLVWENVPGVLSSNGGRDFGAFLGMLAELGYGWAYRVLDAQHFGVPQRRRRVFVVGHLGGWRRAAAVLFERHSLSGNPPPRREAGQGSSCGAGLGAAVSSGRGWWDGSDVAATVRAQDSVTKADTLAFSSHGHGQFREGLGMVTSRDAKDGFHSGLIAHSLRADCFDASEDGTGRGTPIIPVAYQCHGNNVGPMGTIRTGNGNTAGGVPFIVPIQAANMDENSRICQTIGRDQTPSVAFNIVGLAQEGRNHAYHADVSGCLQHKGLGVTGNEAGTLVKSHMAVRRLTPRECERLQGFPDDYTLIPYRGRPAMDGPRYRAIGNSMAVPVMAWIGRRIQMVDSL